MEEKAWVVLNGEKAALEGRNRSLWTITSYDVLETLSLLSGDCLSDTPFLSCPCRS